MYTGNTNWIHEDIKKEKKDMILRGGTCWEGGFGGAGSGKWLMTMIVVHCICE